MLSVAMLVQLTSQPTLILNVSGTISIGGTLSANGVAGKGPSAPGGGAGGTINIISAASLEGTGSIQALGGNGRTSGSGSGGGAGGGGRIDFSGITNFSFNGDVSVAGGDGGGSTIGERGYGGTIDFPTNLDLTVGGTGISTLHMGYDGSNSYTFETITVRSGGVLQVDGDPTVNGTTGGGVTITATTITVESGGHINADRLGFDSFEGPQPGVFGDRAGGGGYGGKGGESDNNIAGGGTYGSITSPIHFGSGGGYDSAGGRGGLGGGALILNVSANISIGGTLSADGGDGIAVQGTTTFSTCSAIISSCRTKIDWVNC